jgi:hypothetical protein
MTLVCPFSICYLLGVALTLQAHSGLCIVRNLSAYLLPSKVCTRSSALLDRETLSKMSIEGWGLVTHIQEV